MDPRPVERIAPHRGEGRGRDDQQCLLATHHGEGGVCLSESDLVGEEGATKPLDCPTKARGRLSLMVAEHDIPESCVGWKIDAMMCGDARANGVEVGPTVRGHRIFQSSRAFTAERRRP
jgi:hypothetical protein